MGFSHEPNIEQLVYEKKQSSQNTYAKRGLLLVLDRNGTQLCLISCSSLHLVRRIIVSHKRQPPRRDHSLFPKPQTLEEPLKLGHEPAQLVEQRVPERLGPGLGFRKRKSGPEDSGFRVKGLRV